MKKEEIKEIIDTVGAMKKAPEICSERECNTCELRRGYNYAVSDIQKKLKTFLTQQTNE